MDWNTEFTGTTVNVDEPMRTLQEGRNRTGESSSSLNFGGYGVSTTTQGNGPFGLGGIFGSTTITTGYDLVGIKATEVENMRNAIRTYVDNVQKKLDATLETNNDELYKAVRGADVINAVNGYVDKVKTYCRNVTSGLLVFSDKLADVGNAWIQATENIGGNIGSSAGAFSEGTAYTEQQQYRGSVQ